jgi:hypothetical protein
LQDWLKLPKTSFLDKQPELKVTVYGPYGSFKERLKGIARALRTEHGFLDTYIVEDRKDFRARLPEEKEDIYIKNKSYYYLRASNVNLFFLYCGQYNDSAMLEFKHVCDKLEWKRPCCAVFRDTSCTMGRLVTGEIADADGVLVDTFDGRKDNCDTEVVELAAARCMNFLKTKYYEIK